MIHVAGASRDITIARNQVEQSWGPAIGVDAGGSKVTIARNDISATDNNGVDLDA